MKRKNLLLFGIAAAIGVSLLFFLALRRDTSPPVGFALQVSPLPYRAADLPAKEPYSRVKRDGAWFYSAGGETVLPYDEIRFCEGSAADIAVIRQGENEGKYGLIGFPNLEILPAQYDYIARAYEYDPAKTPRCLPNVFYAQKEDQWYTIDLDAGMLYSFKKSFKPAQNTYLFSDFEALVLQKEIAFFRYNGPLKEYPAELFLPALHQYPLRILDGGENTSAAKMSLSPGDYEDQLFLSPPKTSDGFLGACTPHISVLPFAESQKEYLPADLLKLCSLEYFPDETGRPNTCFCTGSLEIEGTGSSLLNYFVWDDKENENGDPSYIHILAVSFQDSGLKSLKQTKCSVPKSSVLLLVQFSRGYGVFFTDYSYNVPCSAETKPEILFEYFTLS